MIESVLFNRKYYNLEDATNFILRHRNLRIMKPPHITQNFIRFRQVDPDYEKYHYVTKHITDGVKFILGYPKEDSF